MKLQYRLITEHDIAYLQPTIQRLIDEEGYEPLGAPFYVTEVKGVNSWASFYCQALTKHAPANKI